MKVEDVMSTKLITVSPDNAVRQAARLMMENRVSGLPVVDDRGRLVGLVTEGDLLRRTELGLSAVADPSHQPISPDDRAQLYAKAHAWRVGDVMVREVITVSADLHVARAAALMQERGIKRLPVVADGKMLGIVSRADLLRAIMVATPDRTASGDEAIRRSIMTRLNEDTGLEGLEVGVTVADGLVHLWGNVESEALRTAARIVAESVRGVSGVVEHFADPKP